MTEDNDVILATSKEFNELATALAKAQGEIETPRRNKTVKVRTKAGGTYTFSYADLAAIRDALRGPLSANGIAYTQAWNAAGNRLETRLMHGSGQWMSMTGPILMQGEGPQELGSALTYQRRYQLCALTGVVADDDDDGNAASGNEIESVNGGAHVKPKMGPDVLVKANTLEPSDPVTQTQAAQARDNSSARSLEGQAASADVTDWIAWSVDFKTKAENLSPTAIDEYLATQQDKLRDMKQANAALFKRLEKAMVGVYPDGLLVREEAKERNAAL